MHCLLTKRKLFKQLKCFEEDFKWAYGRGDTALVIDKPTYHDKDLQKVRLQLLAVIDQDIRLDVQDITPLFFLNIRYKQSYTIFSTLYAF